MGFCCNVVSCHLNLGECGLTGEGAQLARWFLTNGNVCPDHCRVYKFPFTLYGDSKVKGSFNSIWQERSRQAKGERRKDQRQMGNNGVTLWLGRGETRPAPHGIYIYGQICWLI